MKNIIIAAFAAFAVINANAQNNGTVENMLKETIKALKTSQPAMAETSQHTYFYDKDVLSVDFGAGEAYDFTKNIRRNAVSGWALGVQAGAIQMAENFSPTAGIEATFAGKRFLVGAGAEAAISKYNAESSKAGQSFVAPIFSAKAGVIITRFNLFGYNNMGYIAIGYEFKYVLDKNQNVSGEKTYETMNERITETEYFSVEGNSMCHTGFVEARISLRHMSTVSLGVKLYGGAYNRYYQEGSRRKAMFGGSVSLYFNGAKKRTDKNVEKLQTLLENY
jgi:hypothetical protein